jgi:hypothetical protein
MDRLPIDVVAQRGAAVCLTCLFLQGQQIEMEHILLLTTTPFLESLVSWMISRLQSGSAQAMAVLTPALTFAIKRKLYGSLLEVSHT